MTPAELQEFLAAARALVADLLRTGARPDDARLRMLLKMIEQHKEP